MPNKLEVLDSEVYSTLEQFRAVVASPEYKNPALRAALERQLERSWGGIKSQSTHAAGKQQLFTRTHRDANGRNQIKTSTSYMPEVTVEQVELQEKGSVRVVAGGVLQLNIGTKGRR